MICEGVVLGQNISQKGIDVNKAKVEVITNLSPHVNEKDIRNCLGNVGFYRRFIRDFSKLTKPFTNFLFKDKPFTFEKEYI